MGSRGTRGDFLTAFSYRDDQNFTWSSSCRTRSDNSPPLTSTANPALKTSEYFQFLRLQVAHWKCVMVVVIATGRSSGSGSGRLIRNTIRFLKAARYNQFPVNGEIHTKNRIFPSDNDKAARGSNRLTMLSCSHPISEQQVECSSSLLSSFKRSAVSFFVHLYHQLSILAALVATPSAFIV